MWMLAGVPFGYNLLLGKNESTATRLLCNLETVPRLPNSPTAKKPPSVLSAQYPFPPRLEP